MKTRQPPPGGGREGNFRIPGTFANAHSFGGTLATTLPWLLAVWTQKDQTVRMRLFMMIAILAMATVPAGLALRATVAAVSVVLFGILAWLALLAPGERAIARGALRWRQAPS